MTTVTWEGLLEGEELAHVDGGAGNARRRRSPSPRSTRASRPRSRRAASRASTPTRRTPSPPPAEASTSSSPPARRAGRRSPSTSPCWTPRRRPEAARALPLPDEGAGAGPGPRARRAARSRVCARRSTTATRSPSAAGRSGGGRTLILTNPDMLHVGVLPHHDRWADVLANLRFVVVDEAHVYRGVFGSHVGNVLRRLRRAAAIYGAEPQFLLASATIANPGELAHSLLGLDATVVTVDGAPRAARTIAFWNPPVLDEPLQLRASALGEGSRLLAELVSRNLRTICFAKSRKAAELIHRFASDRLDAETAARLSPYRAGYTPAQRRDIERRLVDGELLGVTATDALELGIDIGLLDCAISVGFPGTVASLRQQWGRAGRRVTRPRRARRQRGRARPVLHARARGAPRPAGRGGHPRPRQPANPRRPRARGRLRGADRRARPRDTRRRGARPRRGPRRRRRAQAHEGGHRLGGPGLSGGQGRPALGEPGVRSRSSTRRAARSSAWSSASGLPRRSTRAPSISTSASRSGSWRSTSRRGPRSSSRSPATTTRRRRRRRPRRSRRRSSRRAGWAWTSSSDGSA